MPLIRLTKIERKRFFLLIICLFGAIAAWLFMALNNNYKYTAKTELIYKDEPQHKAFKPLQPDVVDLLVEGTGWQLLFSRLRIKPQSVTVSLEKLKVKSYILFSEQLDQINKQLETSQKIISVKPDTLYFDFSKRTNKRVPIKLVNKISFQRQYGLASKIILNPAYVNISGPKEELDKLQEWYTDTLKFDDLQKSTNSRIAVKQSTLNNINVYPSSIEVKVPVDEFTEKTVEIPLKIINNKYFYDVKLYPRKVKITLLVSLSSYQDINEDDIEAVVDMNEWRSAGHHKFSVSILRSPEYSKLINIVPNKIDFIIEK